MEACTVWIPLDRTLVILSSIFMVIGTVHYDRLLFAPYLFWATINVTVNTILCIILANVIGQIVYVAWIIVCFEFYSLFIVYSEFRAIPFKLKTLQEYLDSLQAHAYSTNKTVPDSFDQEAASKTEKKRRRSRSSKSKKKEETSGEEVKPSTKVSPESSKKST